MKSKTVFFLLAVLMLLGGCGQRNGAEGKGASADTEVPFLLINAAEGGNGYNAELAYWDISGAKVSLTGEVVYTSAQAAQALYYWDGENYLMSSDDFKASGGYINAVKRADTLMHYGRNIRVKTYHPESSRITLFLTDEKAETITREIDFSGEGGFDFHDAIFSCADFDSKLNEVTLVYEKSFVNYHSLYVGKTGTDKDADITWTEIKIDPGKIDLKIYDHYDRIIAGGSLYLPGMSSIIKINLADKSVSLLKGVIPEFEEGSYDDEYPGPRYYHPISVVNGNILISSFAIRTDTGIESMLYATREGSFLGALRFKEDRSVEIIDSKMKTAGKEDLKTGDPGTRIISLPYCYN